MEVILLEKIANLGNLGDKVAVKAGYARNFLLPFGKATPATAENVAAFEARRAELEKLAAEKKAEAEARAAQLAELTVTIAANAGTRAMVSMKALACEVLQRVRSSARRLLECARPAREAPAFAQLFSW